MEQKELQTLVERISDTFFKRPFMHTASFNTRLKTTGGRYHLSTHNLDFNPKVLEKMGMEGLIGVIKHELCHYHLHILGKGYKHQNQDFKEWLSETGGLRYVPSLVEQVYNWAYVCQSCKQIYKRKRKMSIKKYRCGKCRGLLIETTTKETKKDTERC